MFGVTELTVIKDKSNKALETISERIVEEMTKSMKIGLT
jgi:hypothetical protein